MKIYIAGQITNNPNFEKQFAEAEKKLKNQGHTVMNPAILPKGFEHHEYMKVCYSMVDVCEAVFFLKNWRISKGAVMEHEYAIESSKMILYEEALGYFISGIVSIDIKKIIKMSME